VTHRQLPARRHHGRDHRDRNAAGGEIQGVVVADHLDVVGQFPQTVDGRAYAGWIHSGADFREAQFRVLWGRVADVIARAERAPA
jgi:hypothetical protein